MGNLDVMKEAIAAVNAANEAGDKRKAEDGDDGEPVKKKKKRKKKAAEEASEEMETETVRYFYYRRSIAKAFSKQCFCELVSDTLLGHYRRSNSRNSFVKN